MLQAGCSAHQFDGTVYRGHGFAFRIPAPPSAWQQLEGSGDALAFRDEVHNATILLNARCGLDGDDVPLQALFNHLFSSSPSRPSSSRKSCPSMGEMRSTPS